jgi:hypothetical protein
MTTTHNQPYSDKAFTNKFLEKAERADDLERAFLAEQVKAAADKVSTILRNYSDRPEFKRSVLLKLVEEI